MKIDGKRILDQLSKGGSDRGRVTLYLSKGLYEGFRKSCGKVAASLVIEELMRQFLSSLKVRVK